MKNLTKFQTLFIIIALAIVAAFTDLSLAKLYNANQQKHLYPLSTTVMEINNDTVTVEDSNGNLWSFNGAEDWEINDSCALIMNDNNTKAKIVRALKSMYAYYEGRTEEMEEILVRKCKGTEFFVDNIMTKTQAQIFDFLSQIVKYEMENPFVMNKNTKKTKAKAKAV